VRHLIIILALALSGCASDKQDAHHPPNRTVNTSAPDHVVAMPDTYPNVATKCAGFGHYRVWVVTHTVSDTQPVIQTDESCP
jgi:hypothetical protein